MFLVSQDSKMIQRLHSISLSKERYTGLYQIRHLAYGEHSDGWVEAGVVMASYKTLDAAESEMCLLVAAIRDGARMYQFRPDRRTGGVK